MRVSAWIFILLACNSVCFAQEKAPNLTATAVTSRSTDNNVGYVLGAADIIVIHAANAPDISDKPIRIETNGMVNMPGMGRIKAAGLTVEQLEAEITKRLRVYLEQPEVAVSVSEYHSQPVSLFGEVSSPGVHQLEGRKTLVEMLAIAGGVKPEAGPTVRITRKIENGRIPLANAKDDPTGRFSIAEVDLKSLTDAKAPEKDIDIMAFDVISVPKAEYIFVAGDVNKSGALTLNDGPSMMIMEALASSGGTTKTSDLKNARILRPVDGTAKREQIPVDLARIMSGKETDVQLMAGDVLFVPGSKTRQASLRAVEAAVQAGTMILTYGIIH